MGEDEGSRSRSHELDQVRRMLFSELSEEEGWARIDAALRGAEDADRLDSIERRADSTDLDADLLDALKRLREE